MAENLFRRRDPHDKRRDRPTIREGPRAGRIVSPHGSHSRGVFLSVAISGNRSSSKILRRLKAVCRRARQAAALSRDHHMGVPVLNSRADVAGESGTIVGRLRGGQSRSFAMGAGEGRYPQPVLSAGDSVLGGRKSSLSVARQACQCFLATPLIPSWILKVWWCSGSMTGWERRVGKNGSEKKAASEMSVTSASSNPNPSEETFTASRWTRGN